MAAAWYYFLLAGLFGGSLNIFRKLGSQQIGPLQMAIIELVVAVMVLLLGGLFFGFGGQSLNLKGVGIGVMGGTCSAIGLIILCYGLTQGLAQTGTALVLASAILVNVSMSIIFLGEPISWQRLIGFGFIVVGIVVTVKG